MQTNSALDVSPPNINIQLIERLRFTGKFAKDFLIVVAFTAAALLIHGYHPAAEDAAIYLPAIKKHLNPALYPFGSEFFLSHGRLTWFDELIAWSVKVTHVGLGTMLLLWYVFSIFLVLWACLLLCDAVIPDCRGRWTAVGVVTAVLTIPVAGTSLLMMDPYLTPRSFSTPLVIFALAAVLKRQNWLASVCLLLILPIHPLMTVHSAAFCGAVWLVRRPAVRDFFLTPQISIVSRLHRPGVLPFAAAVFLACSALIPIYATLPPVSPAYHEALLTRSYFFLRNWTWYECLGLVAPLVLICLIGAAARRRNSPSLADLCRAGVLFGSAAIGFGIIFSASPRFESLAEIQPLRAFQSIYVVLFVLLGVELGRSFLGSSLMRHALLLAPVCLGMFGVQRATFPASRHIQWPWTVDENRWMEAFAWIRENTPVSAIFALNPDHMNAAGEDNEGFRAVAERSMLADHCKDSGVVTMFPSLAKTWEQQNSAVQHWDRFGAADFQELARIYGISWLVLQKPVPGVACPYRNESVLVCRVPGERVLPPSDALSAAETNSVPHPSIRALAKPRPLGAATSAKRIAQAGNF